MGAMKQDNRMWFYNLDLELNISPQRDCPTHLLSFFLLFTLISPILETAVERETSCEVSLLSLSLLSLSSLSLSSSFFHEAFCDISHRLGGITSFGVFSDAFPGLKMWDTFACATAKFLTHL
jgi:hypothetical protein